VRRDRYNGISEINVTNLVDVTMVLLIIFMITAPLMRSGMQVDLPESKTTDLKQKEGIIVTLKKDGIILVDEKTVPADQLVTVLSRMVAAQGDQTVLLHADKAVPYGNVISVMDDIKQAGINHLGLVLIPEKDR